MADAALSRRQWGRLLLALVALVWAGMVLGVSALATPIKFEAPSLTLPVALEVGRVTFQMFNRIEWGLGLFLVVAAFLSRVRLWQLLLAVIAFLVVMIQSVWLLPALDARITIIGAGGTPPPADYHLWYIVFETAKLAILLVLGIAAVLRAERRLF